MAFDPALYNLISIKDLATAFNPDKGWVIAIQDPSGSVITKLTAEQLGILLNGNIQLPDGVLSGLNVTIGNATTPKTVSVSPGQYRINNSIYDLNAQYNANINAPGASDRTDAILADDTGAVYYQPNYNGVPIDGTIVVKTFLVPADGSDINPTPVIPAQYAVMNALNNGDFNITGSFMVNGVPITAGGGDGTIIKTGADVDGNGDLDLSASGLPDYAKPFVYVDEKLNAYTIQYDNTTKIMSGFYGISSSSEIKIKY